MNVEIANIILGKIDSLNWLGKYCGMVRTVTISTPDPTPLQPNRIVKKSFPIACNVTDDECIANNTLNDLIPDSKYKSLLYFEDGGVQVIGRETRYIHLRSSLRLVCWLNGKMLGYDGCGISSIAIMSILKELAPYFDNKFNEGNFVGVKINAISEDIKQPSIFTKYSYDEAQTQFLMFPNDYFSLSLRVDFSIALSCLTDFTLLPETVC